MKMENSMEKRIEEQLDGLTKEQVVELNLDNCQTTQIEGLTDEFKTLIDLSLINCGLTSLKGLPVLPELTRLELSDNKLSGTLNLLVTACPKLTHLHLGGNKIKELDALEPLKDLSALKKLDLFNCEVTEADGYREKVFELLPQVTYLDGVNAAGEDDEEEEDEDEENEGESGSEGEEGSEEEEDDEVGLSYLQKSGLEEESDGEDFEPNGTNDDDEEEEEEEEDDMEGELEGEEAERQSPAVPRGRGIKRKHATEEEKDAGKTTAVEEKTSKSTTKETTPAEECNGE